MSNSDHVCVFLTQRLKNRTCLSWKSCKMGREMAGEVQRRLEENAVQRPQPSTSTGLPTCAAHDVGLGCPLPSALRHCVSRPWILGALGRERLTCSGNVAGTTTKEADGAVAEESGESSRLGGVFQEAVTPAVGLPDTAQDAQLKLNFRSTANTGLVCVLSSFFSLVDSLRPRGL